MRAVSERPKVAIPCDAKDFDGHIFHAVGEKYIDAVHTMMDCTPLLIPSTQTPLAQSDILLWADGILFTGSPSNVSPALYNGPAPREGTLLDHQRDATTIPLMKAALDAGVPIFCICRGFQELNVVMGGTLFQHLHEQEGRFDHREPKDQPISVQYGPAHAVSLTQGGILQEILGGADEIQVNSLHGQGIDRLGAGLTVEAVAQDGTIEAVTVENAKAYALAVQWHPEWKPDNSSAYTSLLKSFGQAVHAYAAAR